MPRPADLGLPRNFTVFRELGSDCDDRTYLMRERLEDGRCGTEIGAVPSDAHAFDSWNRSEGA